MATIKTRVTLLKELLALKEVIDTGQIQVAANKNGIKHSNMSKLISDLETQLTRYCCNARHRAVYQQM